MAQTSDVEPGPLGCSRQLIVVGDLHVDATSRRLQGPLGQATLEPRVHQVLMELAGAQGDTVRRERLLESCWPGLVVSEDSLNRAIGELRKALRATSGGVSVETISKTGYRLCVASPVPPSDAPPGQIAPQIHVPERLAATPSTLSVAGTRRRLVLGASLGAVCSMAVAPWITAPRRRDPYVAALTQQALAVIREDRWGPVDPARLLEEAVRLDPADADAWGLLALARRDLIWSMADIPESRTMADCDVAAQHALASDPNQPDAQVALATLMPLYSDWIAVDSRLAAIAKRHPNNEAVWRSLAELHAATGRALDCRDACARLASLQPISPRYAADEIRALWACAQYAEMDRRADAALRAWPEHPGIWRARMETLGFTGRVEHALGLIERHRIAEEDYPPLVAKALIFTFKAYVGKCSSDEVIAAAMEAAANRQSSAAFVIPLLGSLGALREAFEVANAYFLGRGPIRMPYRFGASEPRITETRLRQTTSLFLPPAKPLWSDARFVALCREVGLFDYWRAKGTSPYMLGARPFSIEA
jgi:DNA-binding winged helix-turn-helix (wHTH) protein